MNLIGRKEWTLKMCVDYIKSKRMRDGVYKTFGTIVI